MEKNAQQLVQGHQQSNPGFERANFKPQLYDRKENHYKYISLPRVRIGGM